MAEFTLEPLDGPEPCDDDSDKAEGNGAGLMTGTPKPYMLRADPACRQGKAIEGQVIEVAAGAQPPASPCQGSTCACRYVAMADRRKGERRTGEDRRDMLRFEKKSDRRARDRRKGRDLWKSRGR